jgi:hypothetical protein
MVKVQVKSIFEQIKDEVFAAKNINDIKAFVVDFVQNKNIEDKDKQAIIKSVSEIKTVAKFQLYICNSLLKYEGMGVNRFEKSKDKDKTEQE